MRHRLLTMLSWAGIRPAAIKLAVASMCLTGFLAGERIGHVSIPQAGLSRSITSGLLWNPPARVSGHASAGTAPKAAASSPAPLALHVDAARPVHVSATKHTRHAKAHGKGKAKHGEKKPKLDHQAGKKQG